MTPMFMTMLVIVCRKKIHSSKIASFNAWLFMGGGEGLLCAIALHRPS